MGSEMCIRDSDSGEIIEQGNHQELLSQQGLYSKLYKSNLMD